jgi:hypothetical protein
MPLRRTGSLTATIQQPKTPAAMPGFFAFALRKLDMVDAAIRLDDLTAWKH